MGFWSKLFGKKNATLNINAVDGDGDGKVQDGTIWERPADLSIASVEAEIDAFLKEIAPTPTVDELEKKRKRSEAAKKAAATRAAKKSAEVTPITKKKTSKK